MNVAEQLVAVLLEAPSVWCQTLTGADQMPRMLRIAVHEAQSKGVVSRCS